MYTKKINKKPLLTVLAMVLVCVISVMGTMAYLAQTTDAVVNTFAAASLIDPNDGQFTLKEHTIEQKQDGSYVIPENAGETNQNSYTVYPGVTLPKDPFVRIEKFTGEEAYLFIEVEDTTSSELTFIIDDENWTELESAALPTRVDVTEGSTRTIYVYKIKEETADATKVTADISAINILKDKQVTVDEKATLENLGAVKFYGYLLQATGFTSAAEAWNAVYGATTE